MDTKDTSRHHSQRADTARPHRSGARQAGVLALAMLAMLLAWGALRMAARPAATPADPHGAAASVAGPGDVAGRVERGAGRRDQPAAASAGAAGGSSDRIAWRACPTADLPTRECADFAVPVSYREPQGATIALAVGRVPATDPARRIGSLFLNPGGPGQPGFEDLPFMYAPLPEAIRQRFAVFGFAPRGVGGSAPVRCFDSPEEQAAFFDRVPRVPLGADETAALLRADQELGRRCGARNAALLPHLSSANVARDL